MLGYYYDLTIQRGITKALTSEDNPKDSFIFERESSRKISFARIIQER